jgi:hypothetical protein
MKIPLIFPFALISLKLAAAASAADLPKLPVGMNLAGIGDYQAGYPFRNLMWGARSWLTRNADGSGPFDSGVAARIPLDENGYPLEIPCQPEGAPGPQEVFTIIPNTVEPGRYVVRFDGEGEVGAAMETRLIGATPGRVVIELTGRRDAGGGYQGIRIRASRKGNPVRNLWIVREDEETADLAANPFREDFLTFCRQWHALRFMDWTVTNNSLEKDWQDRKRLTFYTMNGSGGDAIGRWGKPASDFERRFSGGVAIEVMIKLANLTRTDPWFCMPHRATAEYRRKFAEMVRRDLDPSLKVYVEYSNEVWNWQFQQAGWMLQSRSAGADVVAAGGQAWKDGVEPREFPLDGGEIARDGGTSHPERMAALDRRCFREWEEVFAGADRQRLVRVIGVQHSWLDTARRTVEWVMAHGGADAVAPAGYFGPNQAIYQRWAAAGAALTADQVIADMGEALEQDSGPWTKAIGALAAAHGLRYLAYEGGQHIQPEGQQELPYLPALKAAQKHPGMRRLYLRNFAIHQEAGCDLFMAFSSVSEQGSRYGSWGHLERYGQDPAEMPKYQALLDVNPAPSRAGTPRRR